MIYKLFPITGISLLNMTPLHTTLSNIIKNISNEPVINTLIGTTNLYTGRVEIYNFEKQTDENKVLLLMASSSIPAVFPPIKFNNNLYVDGGLLTNELINILPSNNYINITFITPYDDSHNYDKPIISFNDILYRTINILASNFNTKLLYLNQNCNKPIGEINKYYVSSNVLKNYNILNFNDGDKLIELGYKNVMHKRYIIC
jgi:predicted acylesterase/phospholipase RssA